MKTIIAFDFDGTLTKKDSFLEFIKFSKGRPFFYFNIFYIGLLWALFKINLLKRDTAKQYIFSHCFKGVSVNLFNKKCELFSSSIEKIIRKGVYTKLSEYLNKGFTIVIISASIENWITPWASSKGINTVLATIPEIDKVGRLTGKFKSKNCVNHEKVNRLLELFPDRKLYNLISYGNSEGDKELLEFSDVAHLNYFK